MKGHRSTRLSKFTTHRFGVDLVGVIHPDITMAETLPSNYYRDEIIHHKLMQKFASSWNFIGLESTLNEGDVVPVVVGDIPMLMTMKDNKINCVSNVCTHRGMILCDSIKNVSTIICPYHGRTFSLCGKIKHMPMFEDVENFPTRTDDLPEAKVATWHGLIFASLNLEDSFEAYISDIEERMSFVDFSNFAIDDTLNREHHINANWMLYVDNYLEGFHIPYVHKGLNSVIDYSSYKTEVYHNSVLQIGYAVNGEECFRLPHGHADHGKNVAAYYWWIFPNLMLNFYPWGLSINVVLPDGVSATKVMYYGMVGDSNKSGQGAGGDLDTVEHEDQWIVEACNRGMKSKLYLRGRYSPSMEKGVHHFHRLLTD